MSQDTPVIFSRADHWLKFDDPRKYPLVIAPIVNNALLRNVLVDGGSSLNIMFPKTLTAQGINIEQLEPLDTPFFGILPSRGSKPLGHIYLSVTFSTKKNFRKERLRFEVADFESSYNAILGRLAMAKFMAVPHYIYLVMKIPGPNGIITIKGNIKTSDECDQEALTAALEAQARAD